MIKRQYVNTTATASTIAIAINTNTSNTNATTVTTITTMPKGMKMKFLRSFVGGSEMNHKAPLVCRLSKGYLVICSEQFGV